MLSGTALFLSQLESTQLSVMTETAVRRRRPFKFHRGSSRQLSQCKPERRTEICESRAEGPNVAAPSRSQQIADGERKAKGRLGRCGGAGRVKREREAFVDAMGRIAIQAYTEDHLDEP